MKRFLSQEEILQKMAEGWELRRRGGYRVSDWVQDMLTGRTISIHGNTLSALLRKGEIRCLEPREGDPFWLTRYELSKGKP